MQDFRERLKQSREKYLAQNTVEGTEAGREWAKKTAEYEELKRLHDVWEKVSTNTSNDDLSERFLGVVDPENNYEDFWGDHFGPGTPPDEFVQCFAHGALSIFNEFTTQP